MTRVIPTEPANANNMSLKNNRGFKNINQHFLVNKGSELIKIMLTLVHECD